jgi:hypothetical protein
MDTTQLIADVKARFAHNSAKAYLKDKYASKLIVAEQGGLWTAGPELIAFLAAQSDFTIDDTVILIDNFDNPVQVNGPSLLAILQKTYNTVMNAWYAEWKELESKR